MNLLLLLSLFAETTQQSWVYKNNETAIQQQNISPNKLKNHDRVS